MGQCEIRDERARCGFQSIPTVTYMLAVVYDENMNGKLDTKCWGYSNGEPVI
jgi:uncharacterized protein (DUF2141 family)